jgi:hypothetical protein
MKLPASVRVSGIPSPFQTETANVSARGIFFYIDRWMKEGSQVEVTMAFPPQVIAGPLSGAGGTRRTTGWNLDGCGGCD